MSHAVFCGQTLVPGFAWRATATAYIMVPLLVSRQRSSKGLSCRRCGKQRVIFADFEPYGCFVIWIILCRNMGHGIAPQWASLENWSLRWVWAGAKATGEVQGWQTSVLVWILPHRFILMVVDFLHFQKEEGTVKGNTCFDVANSLWNS